MINICTLLCHVTDCLTGGECKYEGEIIIICLFVLSEFSLHQCYSLFLVTEQRALHGNSFHVPAMGGQVSVPRCVLREQPELSSAMWHGAQ